MARATVRVFIVPMEKDSFEKNKRLKSSILYLRRVGMPSLCCTRTILQISPTPVFIPKRATFWRWRGRWLSAILSVVRALERHLFILHITMRMTPSCLFFTPV